MRYRVGLERIGDVVIGEGGLNVTWLIMDEKVGIVAEKCAGVCIVVMIICIKYNYVYNYSSI